MDECSLGRNMHRASVLHKVKASAKCILLRLVNIWLNVSNHYHTMSRLAVQFQSHNKVHTSSYGFYSVLANSIMIINSYHSTCTLHVRQ